MKKMILLITCISLSLNFFEIISWWITVMLVVVYFANSVFEYRKKWNDPVEKQMRIFEASQKKSN